MTDIQYYLSLPYTTTLKRDDEGDVIAAIAELDGCIAHGSNNAEALDHLREAQIGWIEAALAAGQDIPPPDIVEDLPSGKFVVRLPRSLHRRLNKLAKKDDVSLNQLVLVAVTEYLGRSEGRAELRKAYDELHAWHPSAARAQWDKPQGQRADSAYLQEIRRAGGIKVKEEPPGAHRSRGRK